MRFSDWSSDVFSSVLVSGQVAGQVHAFTRAAPRPLFGKEGVWRPGWTARQCTKLHDGAESTLTAPQAPGVNRTSGAGRTPQARVQAATPASAAWRSAWYDERTSGPEATRSEEHTSELQSLMRISYDVFCLKKKKQKQQKA